MRTSRVKSEKCVVYVLSFPNKKVYVGLTSNFERRMYAHARSERIKNESLVAKAIRKYGWNSVKAEVLFTYETWDSGQRAEISAIEKYESFTNGYNLTKGGDGILGLKRSLTPEWKAKIGKANTGKKRSIEHIKIIRRANLGRTHTDAAKALIGATHAGSTLSVGHKTAISLTNGAKPFVALKDGNVVGTWTNMSACARELGVHRPNITHCLTGKLKKTGGYEFRHIDR